ncbi:MAG TPA: amidohydrolase family protein [Gaiellaceae bacterium]|nr:amidohydrolase family protein [Gaiellaceae bacterium]
MIVDAHVHLWDEAHTPQPWMTPEHDPIARPFGADDLKPLLDRNGVDAVVVVQGACLDSDTDVICTEAARTPWIAAVTAWLSLDDPVRARSRLDELLSRPKVRGVRHLIHGESDPHWIMQERVLESLALLEREGLVLELPVEYPRHFDDVVELAARFPGLVLVIDHLGKPPLGGDLDAWERKLRACAEAPNVVAKLSGLNTALDRRDWSAEDFVGAAATAVDAFGAERLMCGSDWPVALLNGDYDRVWEANRRIASRVAPGAEDVLLGGTAARIYHLSEEGA